MVGPIATLADLEDDDSWIGKTGDFGWQMLDSQTDMKADKICEQIMYRSDKNALVMCDQVTLPFYRELTTDSEAHDI